MDRSKQLGEEKVGKLLFKFSLPAIVGMMVNAFYNVVDRIFVSRYVGDEAFSGLTATFPIALIIMAFGMLVGIGTAAAISIKLGQKRKDQAEKILGNAFVLIIISSVILTILGLIFKKELLILLGANEKTINYALDYITIIMFGIIVQNIGFGLNHSIRAEGNPKIAMFTMLIGAVLNIVLDWIFMGPLNWGIKGAALATVMSQAVSSIWVLKYFLSKKSMLHLKKENYRLKWDIVKTIFAIGMSPFAMQLAASAVTAIQNTALNKHGGYLAVGAIGAINSITMMIFMPIFGINQGVQPIIGYNYGAEKYKRVKQALNLAIMAATTICVVGFIIIQLFPRYVAIPFGNTSELLDITAHGIRITTIMIPIIGFQIVSSNFFQAIGKAKISMVLSLSRQVIILIPLLLVMPKIWGVDGVWISSPVADFLASLITAFFVIREIRKLNKKEKAQQINVIEAQEA